MKKTNKPIKTPVDDVLQKLRGALVGIGFFSLCINLLMLTIPLYMLQVFERVLKSENIDTLIMLSIIAFGALLTMSLLEITRSTILNSIGGWVEGALGASVFTGGLKQSLNGGVVGAQPLRDLATIKGFVSGPSMTPLLDAPWVPLFLGVMFILHPILGFIAVAGAVFLMGLAVLNEYAARSPQRMASMAAVGAIASAEAAINNAEVIRAMGLQTAIIGRWKTLCDQAGLQQKDANQRIIMITAASKFLRLALQLIVLGVGALLVLKGEFTPGAMIAGSIILSRALSPVEQALGAWRGMLSARASYARLSALLADYPESPAAMTLPAPKAELRVENVTYVRPGQKTPVVSGASLDLHPGQCLMLMGPSGSGKTTLARLVVGALQATTGKIRLDGIDIATADPAQMGPHIGYLPQDVELFEGTVAENIARMALVDASAPATSNAIVEAARMAGVHEIILKFENGYDTNVGLNGSRLSGGERQRIALARAVYGKPSLLVLDEPNSSLDQDGEKALLKALALMRREGAAILVVSHRSNLLGIADQVGVMEGGRIRSISASGEVREVLSSATSIALEGPHKNKPKVRSLTVSRNEAEQAENIKHE